MMGQMDHPFSVVCTGLKKETEAYIYRNLISTHQLLLFNQEDDRTC